MADDRLYGYPFAVGGLSHLIYRPSVVTDTVSMNWTAFISDTNHTLVLPADSRDGALFTLQFYLAEGGALVNEAGQPDLEVEPLARALEQIALGKPNLLQSRQLKTLDEAWQYYQTGLSDFVWTRADHVLAQAARTGSAAPAGQAYSRVPGPDGALTPLITSWSWAITASDPARQALAAELIQSLTEPEALAAWSRSSQFLPAQRQATSVLAATDGYYRFVGGELERAEAMPLSESSRLLDALGEALFQTLSTETPPGIIAEQVVAALRQ
jgi:ABC-type glycerol-3-phosphate transport system substrate-binding protein